MSNLIEVIKPLVAAGLAALLANGAQGCMPAASPSPTDKYVMQLLGCSTASHTKEEAVECRRQVNRSYGLCGSQEYPRLEPC